MLAIANQIVNNTQSTSAVLQRVVLPPPNHSTHSQETLSLPESAAYSVSSLRLLYSLCSHFVVLTSM